MKEPPDAYNIKSNTLCISGFHKWDGCKCAICGETRDQNHILPQGFLFYVNCPSCSKCGMTLHDWTKDCEKCAKCGAVRKGTHDWTKNCERCSKCSMTRQNVHKWYGCKCMLCEKTNHKEDGCMYVVCGKTNHQWDGCKCFRCGKTRDEGHEMEWAGGRISCKKCGKPLPIGPSYPPPRGNICLTMRPP